MSFTIAVRQGPARVASRLPQLTKASLRTSAPTRAFHQSSTKPSTFFTPKIASSVLRTTSRNAFKQSRGYQQQAAPAADSGSLMRRLLTGGAIFGGTLVAANVVFNRETREDGGMPLFERSYLNQTFMHTGLGLGIIALTARQMVQSGFVYRLMVTNPWLVLGGGLAMSFGTMIGTRMVDPDNYIPKYALWTAFNATQAAFIAPLVAFVPGALIARAGLYTVAMMGSISFVGATAKQEKYMYLGGPLLAGAAIVAVSGLAPLVVPATAMRTLAFTENIWLYGGLAVFGGFTLYDVQKVLHHARLAERGIIKKDPVNESISLELDFINIFVRMVQILMMQQSRRK
ncbi:Bax inhibitor family protein [Xylariaceae sp. FL0016]|nr:Bax inhibitor family protein [Xylariaceae sp. FL0016]